MFDHAHAVLMESEGGYSNRNPVDDPGGETMWGVTARVARDDGYVGPMRDLPLERAKGIARREYWDAWKCDQLPPLLAFQVFDTAYNGGRPAHWLQQALGVTADGIIGAKTIAAARSADQLAVAMRFNELRAEYMMSLKNWPANSRGWTRRLFKCMQYKGV